MRAVLDTNILVSACWKPDGLEAQTVALALRGAFTACACAAILAEYREVLLREKFAPLRARATELLAALEPRLLMVDAATPSHASPDADDNCFIGCAESAEAAYLVTGNLKHFPPDWDRQQSGLQQSGHQPSDVPPNGPRPGDSQPSNCQPSDSQPGACQPTGPQPSTPTRAVNARQFLAELGTLRWAR